MNYIKCKVFLLFIFLFNLFSSCYLNYEEITLDETKYEEEKNLWVQKDIKNYSYIYEHQIGNIPHFYGYFVEVKDGKYTVSKLDEKYIDYRGYCIWCEDIEPKTIIEFCYDKYCEKCSTKGEELISYEEYLTKIDVSNEENAKKNMDKLYHPIDDIEIIKNMDELYKYIYDNSQRNGRKVRITVEYDEKLNIPTFFQRQIVAANVHRFVIDERIFVYDFKVIE